MSEQRPDPHSEYESDERDFSSRLKIRLAIAGGLVAVALAAIPVLDSLTGKTPVPPQPSAPTADSNSGKIVASGAEQSSAPAESAASAPAASAPAEALPGTPVAPDLSKTPGMQSVRPLTQSPAQQQATPPATRHDAAPRPPHNSLAHSGVTQAPFTLPHAQPAEVPRPATPPVHPSGTAAAPAAAPPAPAAARADETPPATRARPQGSSVGYTVQLGLFSNMGNAQKMLDELKSHGIAAHSETRVQLGPFRSRAEAEDAMAKLKSMGYAPLLAPSGGN
ncbi:SPOR domain-containing protein [Paludibacterium yongneupense]|uniref:SPOR domain-containing protein n=1 Tax=Paludibacterium yongneupense TaxID=400061 RepID=UPI000400464E|nr:SPOR domain-containing protein [Paludibacterium yongneupense]